MAGDYGQFQRGGVQYPLVASPFVPALERIDPPLKAALAYWKAMLEKHAGAYFDALVASVGLSDLVGKIVAEFIGENPLPYLTNTQYKLPLLAAFRTEEEFVPQTVAWYKSAGQWTLLYILPPLTAAQSHAMRHVLKAVSAILNDRTEQGYDPDYSNGDIVWEAAGISEIGAVTAKYGDVPGLETNIRFPTLEMTFKVDEIERKNPSLDTFERLDGQVCASNGEPAEDVPVAEFEEDMTG